MGINQSINLLVKRWFSCGKINALQILQNDSFLSTTARNPCRYIRSFAHFFNTYKTIVRKNTTYKKLSFLTKPWREILYISILTWDLILTGVYVFGKIAGPCIEWGAVSERPLSELYTCCVTVISMGRDRHIAQKSVSQATPKQTKKYIRCIWMDSDMSM